MIEELIKRLKGREAHILGHEKSVKSAVLVPLVEHDGEWCVLFEVRSKKLKKQPGEICFPGGRVESGDRTKWDTAVRETSEELGIGRENIVYVADLDVLVPPFYNLIYPFVGVLEHAELIQPNPAEVEEVFYVPLRFLREYHPELHHVHLQTTPPEGFPFEWIPNGKAYKWRSGLVPEYFYHYRQYIIWGLTARILNHFLSLLPGGEKCL